MRLTLIRTIFFLLMTSCKRSRTPQDRAEFSGVDVVPFLWSRYVILVSDQRYSSRGTMTNYMPVWTALGRATAFCKVQA